MRFQSYPQEEDFVGEQQAEDEELIYILNVELSHGGPVTTADQRSNWINFGLIAFIWTAT